MCLDGAADEPSASGMTERASADRSPGAAADRATTWSLLPASAAACRSAGGHCTTAPRLRIAMLAPPWIPIPPPGTAGSSLSSPSCATRWWRAATPWSCSALPDRARRRACIPSWRPSIPSTSSGRWSRPAASSRPKRRRSVRGQKKSARSGLHGAMNAKVGGTSASGDIGIRRVELWRVLEALRAQRAKGADRTSHQAPPHLRRQRAQRALRKHPKNAPGP